MSQIVAIAIGGAIGAISRFSLSGWMHRRFPGYLPAGTLLVNVLGCLLIGFLMAFVAGRQFRSIVWQQFLVTGFLGSLTTFSTFGYETMVLLRENDLRAALWNLSGNVVFGFGAVWLGGVLARLISGATS